MSDFPLSEEKTQKTERKNMKAHYEIEIGGIKYIVTAGENGWLRQVTSSGEDGGTVFAPFNVIRTLDAKEVEPLYR